MDQGKMSAIADADAAADGLWRSRRPRNDLSNTTRDNINLFAWKKSNLSENINHIKTTDDVAPSHDGESWKISSIRSRGSKQSITTA